MIGIGTVIRQCMYASAAILVIAMTATQHLARAESSSANSAALATPSTPATDSLFKEPYIDVDEWRDAPARHRYVHGGFKGTDTRFSFYFPAKEHYQGRFFQYITPVPDSENLSQGETGEQDRIGFALASGAYFVETNGGGPGGMAMPG